MVSRKQNLCESLEEANYSLLQVFDDNSVLLLDNDTEKPEVWYLHEVVGKPACYTIQIDIKWVTYYAEFCYTPSAI